MRRSDWRDRSFAPASWARSSGRSGRTGWRSWTDRNNGRYAVFRSSTHPPRLGPAAWSCREVGPWREAADIALETNDDLAEHYSAFHALQRASLYQRWRYDPRH